MAHTFNLKTYISFLTANGNRYSGVEASKALANTDDQPAHDTISRFLASCDYSPDDLWTYVHAHVSLTDALIVDDTVLDKQRSRKNELAHFHWSGNAHRQIRGISLVNLLSTDGTTRLPIDYRVYEGADSKVTKHDHFQTMLETAKKRGFKPSYVMADCWYASLDNMKKIVQFGWKFIMGLKENRLVNEVQGHYVSVSNLDWTDHSVRTVWLKGFGFVLVARIVFANGDTRYICTNDLSLTNYDDFSRESKKRWSIEEFHRGIKQTTGIEKCYSIKKQSQFTHIFASFVAFIKLELNRLRTGISWYEQKAQLVRLGITQVFA
jgi:putative transposase